MAEIKWHELGEKLYETGVHKGVLFPTTDEGKYGEGVAWNGLTAVNESPSGAESNKQYADNVVYLNLQSNEEFAFTIEAFTYPDEFEQCDGTASPVPGLSIAQQPRRTFGFSYTNLVGNDVKGSDYGRKVHLVWGAQASPSEKSRATVNETPEATPFSWESQTTPVNVPGHKPTSHITLDSTKLPAAQMAALEAIIYGTAGEDARMPTPGEVIAIFEAASVVEANPVAPAYDSATNTLTIPTVTGVVYTIEGEEVPAGPMVLEEDTLVRALAKPGYRFPAVSDPDWVFEV